MNEQNTNHASDLIQFHPAMNMPNLAKFRSPAFKKGQPAVTGFSVSQVWLTFPTMMDLSQDDDLLCFTVILVLDNRNTWHFWRSPLC